MLMIEAIAAFSDNYIWLLHDGKSAHVVDPGDAAPVQEAVRTRGLQLQSILITHHHFDHVGGVAALKAASGCRVYGPANPAIEGIDQHLQDGDTLTIASISFTVIAVPGHTLDHIAYYGEARAGEDPLVFCGDTLFAGGCGRLFEGNPPMMHASLHRLAALPPDTRVYCAHEYTLANLAFARAADPHNSNLQKREQAAQTLRAAGTPTLPSTIEVELATNPFLRSHETTVQDGLRAGGRAPGDTPVAAFAALRAWKDVF